MRAIRSDPILMKVLAVIRRRACERGLRETDVAEEIGVQSWSISRRLKRQAGRGFWQEVHRQRSRVAACLLQDSILSVKEIAAKCGYERASDMNEHFRKCYGMTPREWRRLATIWQP